MVRITKPVTTGNASGKLVMSDYDEVEPWAFTDFWKAVCQERVDFPLDGGWVTREEIEEAPDFRILRVTDRLEAHEARKKSGKTGREFSGNQYQVTLIAHGNMVLAYSDDAETLPDVLRSKGAEPFGISGIMVGLAAPTDAELEAFHKQQAAAAAPAKKKVPVRRK